jgi:hypothetical protein
LKCVANQTPEIVAHAINNDPSARKFIRIPWTDEIEMELLFLTI